VKNKSEMTTAKRSNFLYWILFLLSVGAAIFVYSVGGGYASMTLPFIVTFFALALNLI